MIRRSDNQGRVCLGRKNAGREYVIYRASKHEMHVIWLDTIPKRDQWVYRNPKVLASLMKGLEQARARKFSKNPPDLDADLDLAERCRK